MPAIGGGIEELDGLRKNFDLQVTVVDKLVGDIDKDLGATYWEGPAADRFKTTWNTDYKKMLNNLKTALMDASSEVARRRQALLDAGS